MPGLCDRLRLYLITDDRGRSRVELARIVEAGIAGGVTAVQYREKSASALDVRTVVAHLSSLCEERDVLFLLNGDLLCHVPGCPRVHLNRRHLQGEISWPDTAQTIGYSAHGIGDARAAEARGVDFVTLSPVFDTPSKTGILEPIGIPMIRSGATALPGMPVVGLGGIDFSNAAAVVRAGAAGVAVMRAIMDAPDPEGAARKLREAVELGQSQQSTDLTE